MTQSRREQLSDDATQLALQLPAIKKPPTVIQSFITGSVAGAGEVLVNHPLWSIKTRVQCGEAFTLNPIVLYRGLLPNMASMVPISALQVGLNRCIQKVFSEKDAAELSVSQRIGSAFAAGMGSAFVSCPTEMVMNLQRKDGRSFYAAANHLMKQGGASCLYTALPATALREGIFTSGYLAGKPVLKPLVQTICADEKTASFTAGVLSGAGATLISQGIDTIKSAQQDAKLLAPLSFQEAVKKHYASYGTYGFLKGGFWRGARVVSAVLIMNGITEGMENKFRKC